MNDYETGLVFPGGVIEDRGEIRGFFEGLIQEKGKLPWDGNGRMILHACNTGVLRPHYIDGQPWCPAQVIAQTLGVTTIGQLGWAEFSEQDSQYKEIAESTTQVYLWTYNKVGKNCFLRRFGFPMQWEKSRRSSIFSVKGWATAESEEVSQNVHSHHICFMVANTSQPRRRGDADRSTL